MTRIRVRACERSAVTAGNVLVVELPRGTDKRPREALVLLTQSGELRAYLNLCRHLPIPIDAGSRDFLTLDKQHLLCGTHGALYRLDDGVCIAGPCVHLALESLPIEEEDGVLYVMALL